MNLMKCTNFDEMWLKRFVNSSPVNWILFSNFLHEKIFNDRIIKVVGRISKKIENEEIIAYRWFLAVFNPHLITELNDLIGRGLFSPHNSRVQIWISQEVLKLIKNLRVVASKAMQKINHTFLAISIKKGLCGKAYLIQLVIRAYPQQTQHFWLFRLLGTEAAPFVLWYYHLIAVHKFYGIDLGPDYIRTLPMYSWLGLGHFQQGPGRSYWELLHTQMHFF